MFIQGMPVNLLGVSSSDSESADDDDDVNDARDSTEQEVNQLFETSDEDGEKDKEKKKPTKTKKQLARQQRAQEWQRIKARVTLVLKEDNSATTPVQYAEYYTFVRDVSHIYFNTMKRSDRLHLDRQELISSAVHTAFDGNPKLVCL